MQLLYVTEQSEAFKAEYLVPTIKHKGSFIMVWTCMSDNGHGEIFFISWWMDLIIYVAMLSDVLEPSITKLH